MVSHPFLCLEIKLVSEVQVIVQCFFPLLFTNRLKRYFKVQFNYYRVHMQYVKVQTVIQVKRCR